ncbi:MAG TPA: ABC transporter permease [Bryobacteraceae bacterium]|jgi:putative ABC transport system permease protein|nr:ABC transporter permease [Bryobacteraceae bacterium]
MLENLLQDVRHGLRLLLLNPGFALVAILSLALGIGANTAIFQLLDAVRLRTLPVQHPEQLAIVKIGNFENASGSFQSRYSYATNPQWEQIRALQQGFSGIFAWTPEAMNLARGGEIRMANILWVSGDFFDVLGVKPQAGRLLNASDDRRGCAGAAIISDSFWRREYGASPTALQKTLNLGGHSFQIVGITPPEFFGVEVGRTFDAAIPLCVDPILRGEYARQDLRDGWWLAMMGRLKPGWTLERATAQLEAISPGIFEATLPQRFQADDVKFYLAYKLKAFPAENGFSELRSDYSNPLWMLLAIAGLVLLIACANLANLMLARASAREKEIAVRLALGASRARLIRQLLSESLLLACAGAICGILLARLLSGVLVAMISTQSDTMFLELAPDYRVLGFTAALAVLTCILFGLAPALRATKSSPASAMRASGRGLTANRERFGLRRILVVTQVALSLVLLVGALLFVGSLRNLMSVNAGFRQDGILVANLGFESLNIPKDRRVEYRRQLVEKIRAIPGVVSAAHARIVPLSGSGWNQMIFIDGKKKGGSSLTRVMPGYFATLNTPLVAGRDFDSHDVLGGVQVAVVNEAFVKKYFDGANPVGKRFNFEGDKGQVPPVFEVVGVVKNTKYYELREDFKPIAFFPESQEDRPNQYANVVVRADMPLAALVAAIKRSIAEVSPSIDVDFHPFKTQILDGLLRERLMATLSGFFGALAALLAVIGLYGVISYMVARRTNEIGIRMALGADGSGIVKLILREAILLLVIGLVVGTALAMAAARTAASMLFGLKPYDPTTLAFAISALAVVALAASYIPARRAAGVDPMVALREE